MPKNLENYYQEIGRAGRDGAPGDTLMFYSYKDYTTLRDMLVGSGDGSENTDLQLSKLDRMKDYAESLACRRRVLLNYFSEDHGEDCGNCDICANPPERFDGTQLAQKALSAAARLREGVSTQLLIDVLRGSRRADIVAAGYDQIKTFGLGKDVSAFDWNQYVQQLVSLGYLYIAHEDHNNVKLTPAAKRVLFEGAAVELVRMRTIKERRDADLAQAKGQRVDTSNNAPLFEALRAVRKELAEANGVPPYVVFGDATLHDMVAKRPVTESAMLTVSGVGEVKLKRFGDAFMTAIQKHILLTEQRQGARHARQQARDAERDVRGDKHTHLISYEAYQEGETVEAIAQSRKLTPNTVRGHLARAYGEGHALDPTPFVSSQACEWVEQALTDLNAETSDEPIGARAILDHVCERHGEAAITYDAIHFARASLRRAEREMTPA